MNRPEAEWMAWDAGPAPELSAEGAGRRRAMLDELLPAVRGRRRRRAAGRAAAVAAPIVGAALLGWVLVREQPAAPEGRVADRTPAPGAREAAPMPPEAIAAGSQRTAIVMVRTDAGIVERLRVRAEPSRVERIGDRELNTLLAEAGLPAGVIRTPDRVMLAAELERPRPENGLGPSGRLPEEPEPDMAEGGREVAVAYSLRR